MGAPTDNGAVTVLVVDDDPTLLEVVAGWLEASGLQVVVARDGASALEEARRCNPSLILMDVVMPSMDGLETCRRLKADEALREIPVVFMTGFDASQNRVEGFRSGAVDYVAKPLDPEELWARVNVHLRLQAQSRKLRQQATALETANQRMREEVAERQLAEEAARRLNAELEQRVAGRTAELEATNRRLTRMIEERLRDVAGRVPNGVEAVRDSGDRRGKSTLRVSEERLERVNECLLSLGIDYEANINALAALCGELLGGTCALYNRVEAGMLCSQGQWNTPQDLKPEDRPKGHICYDLIRDASKNSLVIRNLPETTYAKSDPNVLQYGLKTYIGHVVRCGGERVGCLCVVYQTDVEPSDEDLRLLEIAALALGVEDERGRADMERRAHVHFLESLDLVNRAVQRAEDAEQLLWDVARITLSVLKCDRAWLLFPCDPDAPTYRVPVEVTRAGYPGACELDLDVPMKPGADEVCRALLAREGPVSFGPEGDLPLYKEVTEQFGVQSQLIMGVFPKTSKPWMFGMHQCSHPRFWKPEERRLFEAIAWRIGDGLSSLLIHRDLRQSEERFRALSEQAADAFFLLGPEGQILDANQRACDSLGYCREELLALNIADVDVDVEPDHHAERFWKEIRPGNPATFEGTHRRKDGSTFPVEVRLGVLQISGSKLMLGLARDVTERKLAEKQRLAHLRFLQDLDRINDAILTGTDPEGMLDRVLETVLEVFQADRAWLLYPCDPDATTWRVHVERTRPEYPGALELNEEFEMTPTLAEYFRELIASGEPLAGELKVGEPEWDSDDKYGVRSHIEMAICPRLGKAWQFGLHQCSYARVWTEDEKRLFKEIGRRIADGLSSVLFLRNLREGEKKYRDLVENQPIGVVIHRPDGEIVFANPAMSVILGLVREDELVGRNVLDFVHPDSIQSVRARLQRAFDANEVQPAAESKLIRKDGSSVVTENTTVPVAYLGEPAVQVMAIDISERKQAEAKRKELEAQLHRSQKLEAVGQLAGGVAHDFNNILTAILGNVELNVGEVRRRLGADHKAVKAMDDIAEAARRAAILTRQLLTFSRRNVQQPVDLNLNGVLVGLDKMLRRLISENIVLSTSTDPQLDSVRADPGQVEQVIVNLVVNAVHAMPDGGRLTLETRNEILDEGYVRSHAEAQSGAHVVLVVSDTGHGMDAATQERIFEPFFTTKSVDKGTGLGLATVHGIVRQSGGHINVYSEPGRGSTFKVYLPAVQRPREAPPRASIALLPSKGHETLLLCEDDKAVRELTAIVLESAGYSVLVASGGQEAQSVVGDFQGPISLLITDVIMTDMNGRQLSNALRAKRPGLPTLFISGYPSNVIAQHGVLEKGVEFLEKPFSCNQLLSRVREVLDSAKAGRRS